MLCFLIFNGKYRIGIRGATFHILIFQNLAILTQVAIFDVVMIQN